jgi:hypothetical protein
MKRLWIKRSVFILVVGFIGALFVLYVGFSGSYQASPVFRQTINPIGNYIEGEVLGASCRKSGVIEFLYYSDPPKKELKNNKFGMYIYAEEMRFFDLAEELVNSNGGDWGYVLIPYNVKDRDFRKWDRVFKALREKHLIPIIQLYDVDVAHYKQQTLEAASFLNRFVWPVRDRYVSVYNEPNDAKFWKGKVDPEEYAEVLNFTITAFKKESPEFFMMNGAFNSSAPTATGYMDAETYMYLMNRHVPGIFERLDGWASHPYPQPNFSGSPLATGRWSIRAYEKELEFLRKNFGIKKDLPVFITETGWAHAEGERYNYSFLPVNKVAEYMQIAYEQVWLKDDRVMAVTPFTIWYEPPFDHFAWINREGEPYAHFHAIKAMEKVAGNPAKLEVGRTTSFGCGN